MSYVLDALKKADAERERGAVPGLHAQPAVGLLPDVAQRRAVPQWLWMLLGFGIASALAVAVWGFARSQSPVQPAPDATPSAAAPVAANETAERKSEPSTPPATGGQPAQGQRPEAAVPRPQERSPVPAAFTSEAAAPPRSAPRTAARSESEPKQAPARVAVVPEQARKPYTARSAPPAAVAAASASPAATQPTSSDDGRIVTMAQLPPDLRRDLPPLTIGGSIYSDNPASRFVIINGQVFHENDQLGPDLTLEQIRLKLAVLRFKGVRFRIMY